ncbi:uncharacterized protein LOC103162738 isoform X2 [Cricetulus griseus]|nr:uncharacterized protein LOC103162738 isoform X2 [Cricetulus griseus]
MDMRLESLMLALRPPRFQCDGHASREPHVGAPPPSLSVRWTCVSRASCWRSAPLAFGAMAMRLESLMLALRSPRFSCYIHSSRKCNLQYSSREPQLLLVGICSERVTEEARTQR